MATAAPDLSEPRRRLLAGDFRDKGQFSEEGGFRFADPDLQALLETHLKVWAPTVYQPEIPGAKPAKTKPVTPGKAPATGDSAGKAIKEHPPWVTEFQDKLILQQQPVQKPTQFVSPYLAKPWDEDSLVAERLVEAYLRSWTKKINRTDEVESNLEEFYRYIGRSESSNQSTIMGGPKGSPNWCGPASERAIVLGLMRNRLRFKSGKPPVRHNPKFDGPADKPEQVPAAMARAFERELREQINFFHNSWYHGRASGGKTADPDKPAGQERLVAGDKAWTAPLDPGDYIYVINGALGSPISGHVATVIQEVMKPEFEYLRRPGTAQAGDKTPQAGDVISTLKWVSGNARGEGIRTEEVDRVIPPSGYRYLETAGPANTYDAAKSQRNLVGREHDKLLPLKDRFVEKFRQHMREVGENAENIPWTELPRHSQRFGRYYSYYEARYYVDRLLELQRQHNQAQRLMERLVEESPTPVHKYDDPKYDPTYDPSNPGKSLPKPNPSYGPVRVEQSWVVSIVRASLLNTHRAEIEAAKVKTIDIEATLESWLREEPQGGGDITRHVQMAWEGGWDQEKLDRLGLESLSGTIDSLYPGALLYLESPPNR